MKVTSTIETITPEVAKEYLEKNENNRKLNKAQVMYYARMLREGEWMLNGDTIVFDQKGTLIDGQHRLHAVIEANIPMQTIVVRNVDCESFTTKDKGKTRSAGDSFCIMGIDNSNQIAASVRRFIVFNRVKVGSLSTVSAPSCTNDDYKVSDNEMLNVYNEHPDFWQEECRFASICYSRCRLLSKTEIMTTSAYLQLTKGYNAEVVHEFFSQLFFEEATENETLAIFRRMVVNDAMKASGIRMTPKYKTQLLIKCWDAFKSDKVYKRLVWIKEREGELYFE